MSEQQQTPTIQQAIDLALQHHNGGRLPQAESIYQQILQTNPDQPVALHLLGVIAHQAGKNDTAVDLIARALALKPDLAEAHSNLGLALQDLGKSEDAIASYRKALALKPDYAEAHSNLGLALTDQGKQEEAIASYHKALAIKPDYAEAHNNLGNALQDLGKLDEAVASYHKALALNPDYAEAHNNLGVALKALGKLDEAIARYHKALGLKPDYADAHNNLGNALRDLGKLDEAIASYHKALATKPDYAEAHNNLGVALQDQGKQAEAVASYHKALALKPDFAEARVALAIRSWIHAKQHDCTNTLSQINPKTFAKRNESFAAYYVLLKKLTEYITDHPQKYELHNKFPFLFSLGDSHCLPPAHTTVSLYGTQYRVEPKIIIGCRAWNLGNTLNSTYKIQFKRETDSLASGTTAVVMFGEIDCRPNLGILPHHKETGNDLPKAICELVQSYVEYVTNVFGQRGITPIFYGVPARIIRKAALPSDDEAMLSYIIGKFNQVLAMETKKRNMPFLDIYSLTNDADGQSSGGFHIDTIHVLPSALGHLTKQL